MEIYPYNWSKNEENNNLFYFLIDQQALKCVFWHTKNDKKYTWGQKLHDVIHILLLLSNEGTSECLSFCYFCEEVSPQFQSNHQVRTSSMAGNPAERNKNEMLKKIMTSSIFESQDDHLI